MSQVIDAEAISSDIRFERVSIDPILAQKWLDTRELNIRSMRRARVEMDALDMVEGRWFENGDVIRLAPDGELLDGMHRLSAISALTAGSPCGSHTTSPSQLWDPSTPAAPAASPTT
jgi:hypothetical protein